MKVCLNAPVSKSLHYAEASQLTLTECQISGLHMTQGNTERSLRTDLKITRTAKSFKKYVKIVKIVVKRTI